MTRDEDALPTAGRARRRCIRHAGTLNQCPRNARAGCPYCHGCLSTIKARLNSLRERERGIKSVAADLQAAGWATPAAVLVAELTVLGPRPKCVGCQQRKALPVGGRFCSNGCAVSYAVAVAQTKRWDEGTEEWTRAEGVA